MPLEISGLEDAKYLKPAGTRPAEECGNDGCPLVVDGTLETERLYPDVSPDRTLELKKADGSILRLRRAGTCPDIVVWNMGARNIGKILFSYGHA